MLMVVIIIAKVIGMLRDVVLANYFGTSYISDAYLIASSVPTLLFYFIGHALSTAYIPMFNRVRQAQGKKCAEIYTDHLISAALLLCTVIAAVLLIWPNAVVKVFAVGFDDKTAAIAARFIRIGTSSIYLMTFVHVFGGYLQANGQFLVPAAISVPRNIVIILSIIIAAAIHIDILGWGLLFAYIAELLLLIPFVLKKGYCYKPIWNLKDTYMEETMYLILPILLGTCVGQVNKIVDRSLASTVTEGGVSALSYASILNTAVQEVLVTGIITVLFASCAELVVKDEHEQVKDKLKNTINTMLFLLIPASVGIILLAEPIVKVVLCRGAFDDASIRLTTGALRCYTVGLVFLAVRDTLVKVFYAYKDTKTTTVTSIIAILLNLILNFVFVRFIGTNGLALSTSLSAIFNSIALYIFLKKKIGNFGTKENLIVGLKSVISSVVMACGVFIFSNLLHKVIFNEFGLLVLLVFFGMCIYLLMSCLLKTSPIVKWMKWREKNNEYKKV